MAWLGVLGGGCWEVWGLEAWVQERSLKALVAVCRIWRGVSMKDINDTSYGRATEYEGI